MNLREKILIVDDNLTNIEILQEYLETDYELAVAASGVEALRQAQAFQPALILLDIMMPDIDGYEVCRRLRAHPRLRHAKIIMVSAKAMLTERLQGYEAGADDYITKPFDEEELLAKVRVYLRLKYAEEMERLKGDLLALLSHETGTPLTSIISPVEMLLANDNMDIDNQRMLLTIVHESALKLQSLFEKILLLSEIKSGRTPLQVEPADLGELVRLAVQGCAVQGQEREVRIEERLAKDVMALLDRDKIRHVVKALLDNAIRFSPAGAAVVVTVARQNDACLLEVSDSGPGIEPRFLPQVFEEFASTDIDYHAKGHGLSLAIARHIVQAHGGKIDVTSVHGQGATFTVRLPAA